MRIELIDKGIVQAHRREVVKADVQVRDKFNEQLSDRELRDLMGTNRATYARKKGGAFRQR